VEYDPAEGQAKTLHDFQGTHLWQEQLHPCPQHEGIQELHACVVKQVATLQPLAVQLPKDLTPDGGGEDAQDLHAMMEKQQQQQEQQQWCWQLQPMHCRPCKAEHLR
jgi:hypothetical protein